MVGKILSNIGWTTKWISFFCIWLSLVCSWWTPSQTYILYPMDISYWATHPQTKESQEFWYTKLLHVGWHCARSREEFEHVLNKSSCCTTHNDKACCLYKEIPQGSPVICQKAKQNFVKYLWKWSWAFLIQEVMEMKAVKFCPCVRYRKFEKNFTNILCTYKQEFGGCTHALK